MHKTPATVWANGTKKVVWNIKMYKFVERVLHKLEPEAQRRERTWGSELAESQTSEAEGPEQCACVFEEE